MKTRSRPGPGAASSTITTENDNTSPLVGPGRRTPIVVITEHGRRTFYAYAAHWLLYSRDPLERPPGAASAPARRAA